MSLDDIKQAFDILAAQIPEDVRGDDGATGLP